MLPPRLLPPVNQRGASSSPSAAATCSKARRAKLTRSGVGASVSFPEYSFELGPISRAHASRHLQLEPMMRPTPSLRWRRFTASNELEG